MVSARRLTLFAAGVAAVSDRSVRAHVTNLLVNGLFFRCGADQRWTSGRVVHQEKRRGRLLVVTRPLALTSPVDGVVDHAVGGQGAVAHHVKHQRHTPE